MSQDSVPCTFCIHCALKYNTECMRKALSCELFIKIFWVIITQKTKMKSFFDKYKISRPGVKGSFFFENKLKMACARNFDL